MGSTLASFFHSAEKYIGDSVKDSVKPRDEKQKNRRILFFFLFIAILGLLIYFFCKEKI